MRKPRFLLSRRVHRPAKQEARLVMDTMRVGNEKTSEERPFLFIDPMDQTSPDASYAFAVQSRQRECSIWNV